jgi:competence protein ComGC
MLIISVLLILIIPNVMKHRETIQNKGCNAFVKNVQAQVEGYMLDNDGKVPTIEELLTEKYITQKTCPNGSEVQIGKDGTVSANGQN